jgi:hypothetical protein
MNTFQRLFVRLSLVTSIIGLLLPTPLVSANRNEKCRAAEKRGDKRVEAYKGDAVRLRANLLEGRHKGFARALKEARKRGRTINWENSLTLVSVKQNGVAQTAAPAFHNAAYSSPQDTFSIGDEEVTLITFDGDTGTWDGIVYFNSPTENSVYQTTVDGNGLFDLSAVTVTQEIYYPPDGGDPINCDSSRVCPMQGNVSALPSAQSVFVNASFSPKMPPPGIFGRIWGFIKCVAGHCADGIGSTNCGNSGTFRRFFVCIIGGCVQGVFANPC